MCALGHAWEARGSFDYIWRIEGLPSSQEEGNFRSQFEAKGLEWYTWPFSVLRSLARHSVLLDKSLS